MGHSHGARLRRIISALDRRRSYRAARDERSAAVSEALDILRLAQPQRLRLPQREPPALFPKPSHDQTGLQAPRWIERGRARISRDEARLAMLIVFVLISMYGILALQYVRTQAVADRNEQAVGLVSAQDIAPIRLAAMPDAPSAANGMYWGRAGSDVAVLTLTKLPPAPAGARYRAWERHADRWTSIGVASPDATGSARLIAQSTELVFAPDALKVTLELYDGSPVPSGQGVLAWP
jgi:hypothetical protein